MFFTKNCIRTKKGVFDRKDTLIAIVNARNYAQSISLFFSKNQRLCPKT